MHPVQWTGLWLVALAVAAPAVAADDEERGFVSIFDGRTLEGWTGSTKGYTVENGVLVCLKEGGGNLYTQQQYSDFVFRFEFRMEPGGNNGVGLRAPLTGDVAYQGMEIQLLDDDAERYRNLKPYQYCGSIYGVVPAKRGHLKPAGQWNSMEITCRGREVKVVLNGETIVDANLDKAAPDGKTIDGREHPGLQRTSGHLGFLGHGARVEFRNLRVKDLAAR